MRTLAHLSDLHFGRIDPAIADALVADLAEAHPDLVVVSGDLTQRARRSQYAAAVAYLQRLPRPQLVVPGNHDIPLYDVLRRLFSPLGRYRQYVTDDLAPFHSDAEIAVAGLMTARALHWTWNGFWKDGRVNTGQLEEMKRQFGGVSPALFRVVVTHHPFIPPPGQRGKGIVGRAAMALNAMELCGVDMVLAGHLHQGYSGDVRTHHEAARRSILSIQAGTATSTRRRDEPNAYNLIRIDPPRVSVTVRAFAGGRFVTREVREYVRTAGTWQSASAVTPAARVG